MNITFIVNDYMLIWNLLFGPSISESTHKLKQRLWLNYRKQYVRIQNDQQLILADEKNFIPDDDTLYNLFFETNSYETIKKETDKYRLYLLKIWDKNKKDVSKILKEILRFDLNSYKVLVVHPNLNVIDYATKPSVHALVYGKENIKTRSVTILTELIYGIIKRELQHYNDDYKEIVQAVLELAILNEFATQLDEHSHYLIGGDPTLKFLKRQIYPYWLMYLGADKESMIRYMMRDKIAFDADKYAIETELKKTDLRGFIDFCIKNQKYIVKINDLEMS